MKPTSTIRLLTETTNEKGDLFTRLMDDLFIALGFRITGHDIAKPGREIDVHGVHLVEKRLMRAECKAHKATMGGDAVNKFRGALLAEQNEVGDKPIAGYFVSLSGFTQSAIEQEAKMKKWPISLVSSVDVIKYLERGNFIISNDKATEQSGRCAQRAGIHEAVVEAIELLGHEMGYIKAVYYAHNKQRTHFALIHADGTPLAKGPALVIVEADKILGGSMHQLHYLEPAAPNPDMQAVEQRALTAYHAWVKRECGFIQLDGLPLDGEFNKNLELEKLFVPLRVTMMPPSTRLANPEYNQHEWEDDGTFAVGERLASIKHLAVLAAPGSGKSTLLKRLATAYAFAERRTAIKDELPDENWLPLLLRCRTLRGRTNKPVLKLLERLAKQLDMPAEEAKGFRHILRTALHNGKVLLLVDGLDEIWEESERKEFAYNLRTFIGAYPQVHMVVTSREAGFRLVGGIIADFCQQTWLAPLELDEIASLCEHWHLQVYGDSVETRAEIDRTVDAIAGNSRIMALAENPLLLTTLLIVKRSEGEMPTNRVALYSATVKMLVRTWNIEGFNALNERETFAQLCYVACAMMEAGEKQITKSKLLELLQDARQVLAAELHATKLSPEDFLIQVEHRSSLLMMTGQQQVHGEVEPVYEFRHLTFQEFLAARGYVRRLHARRKAGLSLTQILEPYFENTAWQEVIALIAVLAEIDAEPLIERLIALCEQIPADSADLAMEEYQRAHLLGQCILDEVTVEPQLLRSALKQVARLNDDDDLMQMLEAIRLGPAGPVLEDVAQQEFVSGAPGWEDYGETLRQFYFDDLQAALGDRLNGSSRYIPFLTEAIELLSTGERQARIRTALNIASIGREWHHLKMRIRPPAPHVDVTDKQVVRLQDLLMDMVSSADKPSILAASWALALWRQKGSFIGAAPATPLVVAGLLRAWYRADSPYLARTVAWAFANQALLEQNSLQQMDFQGIDFTAFLTARTHLFEDANRTSNQAKAVAIAAWYLRPWPDTEIAFAITQAYATAERMSTRAVDWQAGQLEKSSVMLRALGKIGEEALAKRSLRMIGKENKLLPGKKSS